MTVNSPCPTCGGGNPLDGDDPVCQCGSQWAKDLPRPRTGLGRTAGLSRGKGLAAGKGFGIRKPMNRGKPLTATAKPTEPRTPIARSAPAARPRKARKPRVAPEVRDAVRARAGDRCEVGVTEACRARGRRLDSHEGASQHHRLPGRMGGSKRAEVHAAPNLLQVCGHGTAGCHGAIESDREKALDAGWLLHEGQDPSEVPVMLWDGRRVLLAGDCYAALGAAHVDHPGA